MKSIRKASAWIFDDFRGMKKAKPVLAMMLLDVLFLITMGVINIITAPIFLGGRGDVPESVGSALLYVLIYTFLFIMAYSFFKFRIIKQIFRFVSKKEIGSEKIYRFMTHNLKVVLLPMIIYLFYALIVSLLVRQEAAIRFLEITSIPIFIVLYAMINISQYAMLEGERSPLKKALRFSLKKFPQYLNVIVADILIIGAYMLASGIITSLLKYVILKETFMQGYLAYMNIYTAITAVLFLALHSANRLALYRIFMKNKEYFK